MSCEYRDTQAVEGDLPTRLAGATAALLVLAALLPLGVLMLALSRLKGLETVDQVLAFYIMPGSLALGLFALSRRRPATRLTALLLICAMGAALLAADAVLHATGTIRSSGQPPVQGLTIGEAVDSIRSEGGVAYPTIPGNVLVNRDVAIDVDGRTVHPVTPSPGHETTVLCNETGALIVYQSDRHGFNNPDEVWERDSTEVALLGDSYTHGLCVHPSEQPASLLAQRYSSVNLGARGFGPLLQLAVLREYGALLRPRTVVWVHYEGNDAYDLRGEVGREWLTDYLEAPSHSQGLADSDHDRVFGEWIDGLMDEEFGTREARRSSLLPGFRSLLTLSTLRQVVGFGVPVPSRGSRIGRLPEVMLAADQTVASWGGEIIFVYLPAYERFRTLIGEGVPGRRQVLAAATNTGFNVVDLTPYFEATGTPRRLWASPRGHLGPDGYRVMVDGITEAVEVSR